MPTNTLSDARCKGAKPADKPYKLFDGGGLFLLVGASKLWRLAYRFDGKAKTMSFGAYPDVSLAEARQRRDDAKLLLRDGIDPMANKKPKAAGITLRKASDDFWAGRKDISASYKQNAERAIAMHLAPILDKPIDAIERDDLLDCLRVMDSAGLHSYVRKTRMWIGQVFDWALENGFAKSNPAKLINPQKAFGKKQVVSFAALELHQVAEFLCRLRAENQDLSSIHALRLLAYTWVRTNELRMMEWSEIDGDAWRIPAEKMKRRKAHIIPLSSQALAVIEVMQARRTESKYVFPAYHRNDRPMSENTILALIARIGYKGRMTGHGWRTVASTWANENGYSPDAIERQLAHSPDDKVRAVYNQAQYLTERRDMLQAWADWLEQAS